MPDYVVPIDCGSDGSPRYITVLDADDAWHAQVAAYMHMFRPAAVPADSNEITDVIFKTGPMEIYACVSARIYNPDPYRDYPKQNEKCHDGASDPGSQNP